MKNKLMPHQAAALQRLRDTQGKQLLNLCPGAGKTCIALAYLSEIGAKNVLILAPASVVGVWKDESIKWDTREVIPLKGTPGKRLLVYKAHPEAWLSIGYETFKNDFEFLKERKWDAVILDESHKIASPSSRISRLVRSSFKNVPVRLALSGTPLKNSWMDLWSQIDYVSPGAMLKSWFAFRQRFAIMPIPNLPVIKGWRDVDALKSLAKPHMFTIDKDEVRKNLPPVTVTDIPVELTSLERVAYAQLRDEFRLELENVSLTVSNAMVKVGRLRQCTGGLHVFGIEDKSSKLVALKELLATIGDDKAILFTVFAETARWLAKELGCKHMICGETTDRDALIGSWRREGSLLIGTQAVSNGLNLQEAHYVIQWDLPFTKAEEEQRIGRAWRTGQRSPVSVYNLMATDTIDWGVRKLIEKKASMMDEIGTFTMDDIKGILL